MGRLIARLGLAVLTTAMAGVGVVGAPAPALAAACSGASGVTVVLDRAGLGGGVTEACNPAAGGKASDLFTGSGFTLTYVQRQPGFVCRVDGQPAADPCVNTPPADAYWGLWWSDGTSGSWTYATLGAGALSIPEGGYVAFVWQSGSRAAPAVGAPPHAAAPSPPPTTAPSTTAPTPQPSTKPTSRPSSRPTSKPSSPPTSPHSSSPATKPSTTASSSAAASSSTPPAPTPTRAPGQDATASAASAATSDAAAPTDASTTSPTATSGETSAPLQPTSEVAASDRTSALPAWVVPLVLLVLAGGGVAAYLLRRRRAGP